MSIEDRILAVINRSIDDLNQQFMEGQRISKGENTVLSGNKAELDSLALLNLMVIIEKEIQNEFNLNLDMLGEGNLKKNDEPFLNINSLIKYIDTLLAEQEIR